MYAHFIVWVCWKLSRVDTTGHIQKVHVVVMGGILHVYVAHMLELYVNSREGEWCNHKLIVANCLNITNTMYMYTCSYLVQNTRYFTYWIFASIFQFKGGKLRLWGLQITMLLNPSCNILIATCTWGTRFQMLFVHVVLWESLRLMLQILVSVMLRRQEIMHLKFELATYMCIGINIQCVLMAPFLSLSSLYS